MSKAKCTSLLFVRFVCKRPSSRQPSIAAIVRHVLLSFLFSSVALAAQPYSLPRLIERARSNSYRVREAQARLEMLQAKYREAQWAWFPRINSYVAFGGPTAEAQNDGLGGPPTTQASLKYDFDFGSPGVTTSAGVDVVMPLFTFGKLTALKKAGKKGVEAGKAFSIRARDEAELQVAQAYWAYCLAASGKRVIANALTRLKEAQEMLVRLRENDSAQVTNMDVYKLDYYRNLAQSQHAATENGMSAAFAAIRLVIGALPKEVVEIEETPLEDREGTLPPIERYFGLAEHSRPELKAMNAGIGAREQEVLLRKRMYFPDFGVAGLFRWIWTTNTTRQYSPFAYDPYNDLTAGVFLVARYRWDFPLKHTQLEEARAALELLKHQKDLLASAVRLEIQKAWHKTRTAIVQSVKLKGAEKQARRWATAAFTAFDLGTGDIRELMDAYTAYASSSLQKAQADFAVRVGLHELTRAAGARVNLLPDAMPAESQIED